MKNSLEGQNSRFKLTKKKKISKLKDRLCNPKNREKRMKKN